MTATTEKRTSAEALTAFAAGILEAAGTPTHKARLVAQGLVDADLEGATSHGVMLLPMYVDRITNGSVEPAAEPEVVVDFGSVAVMDAHHGLGQPSSEKAMGIAIDKATASGIGAVAVRHAFHFGTARRYALQAAAQGHVGVSMSNTRPLMPAPGGAERLVGNNPLAIAMPTNLDIPLVLDLAMSQAAMGKIRYADQIGDAIPDNWATDSSGKPTNDPAEAIGGMLLPFGGHKGFGLAFMVDLLCGLLSGGAWGPSVQPLYGDPKIPYDCSHLFIAANPSAFDAHGLEADATEAARRVRESQRAPGTDRLFAPGEPEWSRRAEADGQLALDATVWAALVQCADQLGITTNLDDHEKGKT